MQQRDATSRCNSKMQQQDATVRCDIKWQQQDATAICNNCRRTACNSMQQYAPISNNNMQ
eukprot:11206050-Lingulodinium_polyedra.AAC.1